MLLAGVYFFFVTLIASLTFTPISRWLSFRLNILDHPVGNKKHLKPMPLLGGTGIFGACLVVVAGHLLLLPILREMTSLHQHLPGIVLTLLKTELTGLNQLAVISGGGILIFVVGLLDDSIFFDIRWRLLSEFTIAAVVTSLGIRPELYGVPPFLTWTITIVWIVALTNAFNLLDGMDGMVAGITVISASLMAIFCFMTQQIMVGFLLLILCGLLQDF